MAMDLDGMTSQQGRDGRMGWLVVVGLIVALAATLATGLGASTWIGRPFPGFFVLPNRVIASIGRVGWTATGDGTLYQSTVVAVDGIPVATSADVYRRVRSAPSGTRFTYAIRQGAAASTVTLASRDFSRADFLVIFGSYLSTGLLWLLLGLAAAALAPDERVGRGALLLGGVGGIYVLSAAGIYDPGASLRLHALAEALLPAAMVYLALAVTPSGRARDASAAILATSLSLALAVPYELLLDEPGAYSALHAACEAYMGLAGLLLTVRWVLAYCQAARPTPLARGAVAGALLGLGVPAVVMTLSGLGGGRLPVNLCTLTAFLFPVCLGWGIAREHLARLRGVSESLPA